MKVLPDENIPTKLRTEFGERHAVFTVQYMGWSGKKNGELLGLATFAGFDALVTLDKSLRFQQNLQKFDLHFILLLATDNKLQTLRPFVPKVLSLLDSGDLQKLNIITLPEAAGNKEDLSLQ